MWQGYYWAIGHAARGRGMDIEKDSNSGVYIEASLNFLTWLLELLSVLNVRDEGRAPGSREQIGLLVEP